MGVPAGARVTPWIVGAVVVLGACGRIGYGDGDAGPGHALDSGPGVAPDPCLGSIASEELVLWYRFDDLLEDGAADIGPHGLDGQCGLLCPSRVDGLFGQAARFDGNSGQFFRAPPHAALQPTEGITLSAWIRYDDLDATRAIVTQKLGTDEHNAYWLGNLDDGRLQLCTDERTLRHHSRASDVLASDVWLHVAATWDAALAMLRLFVDGTLVQQESLSSLSYEDGRATHVGIDIDGADDMLDDALLGTLDELQIWKRGLTAEEVARLSECRP